LGIGTVTGERSPAAFKVGGLLRDVGSCEGLLYWAVIQRVAQCAVAGAVECLAGAGRRAFASRRWPAAVRRAPHQVTLLARCLVEAACVRTARRMTGG
jgi:hypothetical protein